MKTYEKYLITEKSTVTKKLNSLRKKLQDIATPIELRLAMGQLSQFIKKHTEAYTDDISKELTDLVVKAKARVK